MSHHNRSLRLVAALAVAAAPAALLADTVTYAFHPVSNPGATLGEITITHASVTATSPWALVGVHTVGDSVITNFWFDLTALGGPMVNTGNITGSHIEDLEGNGPGLTRQPSYSSFFVNFTSVTPPNTLSFQLGIAAGDDRWIWTNGDTDVPIVFFGDWVATPAPGAAALLGLGGLASLRRRR